MRMSRLSASAFTSFPNSRYCFAKYLEVRTDRDDASKGLLVLTGVEIFFPAEFVHSPCELPKIDYVAYLKDSSHGSVLSTFKGRLDATSVDSN